jgi:hypothetical protein
MCYRLDEKSSIYCVPSKRDEICPFIMLGDVVSIAQFRNVEPMVDCALRLELRYKL